ncbi:MAG: bifunctional heptose 7-phosphate kinase/heptose 1-phosphate adenyltransferase [Proteobacteria bacterium]|nr:bifunctional heptose 7-phosphate kinase/heptose 1-phosphate adenyltransferase [Pseudomonadota bacterium]
MDQDIRNRLIRAIHTFTPQKIMVIGDLMLDQYIWGSVDRISPEAPIPVVRVEKEEFRLGGAANVVANIKALDCQVLPVGIVGEGYAGNQIKDMLEGMGVSMEGIVSSSAFQTVLKQRILTRQQQLLRVDHESPDFDTEVFQEELLGNIKRLLPNVNGVVLEDYAKGVLSKKLIKETISEARRLGLPIICDPGKGVDFSHYEGITAIKPNRLEAEQATGMNLKDEKSILKAASTLKEKCAAEFLTISLDKDGFLFYRDEDNYRFIETESPEVHDTTGAGDVFVSIVVVLLAKGVSPELASQMANLAGGLETSHLGVVSIPWSDILKHLANDSLSKKITTLDRLKIEVQNSQETPLIFTNGYFDNISAGHLRFLIEIGKISGKLVVAINSDQSIVAEKGSPPLLKEQDRARLLASVENVHRVVVFDEANASGIIQALSPDVVVKGEHFKNKTLPEQKAILQAGARVEYVRHFSY